MPLIFENSVLQKRLKEVLLNYLFPQCSLSLDRAIKSYTLSVILQVGLAAFDMRTAKLHLSQFIETSRSYQNTATLLQFFDPSNIILPANCIIRQGMIGLPSIVNQFASATKVEFLPSANVRLKNTGPNWHCRATWIPFSVSHICQTTLRLHCGLQKSNCLWRALCISNFAGDVGSRLFRWHKSAYSKGIMTTFWSYGDRSKLYISGGFKYKSRHISRRSQDWHGHAVEFRTYRTS